MQRLNSSSSNFSSRITWLHWASKNLKRLWREGTGLLRYIVKACSAWRVTAYLQDHHWIQKKEGQQVTRPYVHQGVRKFLT